jgi:hypothetical protein
MHTISGAGPDVPIFVYLEPIRDSRVNLNNVFFVGQLPTPNYIKLPDAVRAIGFVGCFTVGNIQKSLVG